MGGLYHIIAYVEICNNFELEQNGLSVKVLKKRWMFPPNHFASPKEWNIAVIKKRKRIYLDRTSTTSYRFTESRCVIAG